MDIKAFLQWYWEERSISYYSLFEHEEMEILPSQDSQEFVRMLVSQSDFKNTKVQYAIGMYRRIDLYEEYILTSPNFEGTENHFMKIWKDHFPFLKVIHDRACPECDKLNSEFKLASMKNPVKVPYIKECLQHHKNTSGFIIQYAERLSRISKLKKSSTKNLCLYVDHWGKKMLICGKKSLVEYKKINDDGILPMSFSGIYNATDDFSHYMVYTSPVEESTNIILNHLYQFLQEYLAKEEINGLYIFSDTHSTQRSNLLFGFFDYLVRIEKVFGDDGFVELVFYHSGHHVNPGDRSHANPQAKLYKYLKTNKKICSPDDFCTLMNEELRRYNFHLQMGFP
jgi:hypothetical protein